MHYGTYILSIDKSHLVWKQQWFENYLIRFSQKSLELLSINDRNRSCSSEKIDLDIELTEEPDSIKQILTKLPFIDTSSEYIHLTKLNLECGCRYSHIYRPLFVSSFNETQNYSPLKKIPKDYYVDSPIVNMSEYICHIRQLKLIINDLYDILKVVEPTKSNMKVYGNAIRNVIMLSCTEVDALMKTIFSKNGSKKKEFRTTDYINLSEPLRLNAYTLMFNDVVNIKGTKPFALWQRPNTTKSLRWYYAYTKIKHDRLSNFKLANLKNAISSVLAYATLLVAVFGYRNSVWNEHIEKVITVVEEPLWKIDDFYFPVVTGECEDTMNHPSCQITKKKDKSQTT